MKSIWKWPLKPETQIEMPYGAKVLTVQTQRDGPVLWALVDVETEVTEKRTFKAYPTGDLVPDEPGVYVGTFQLSNGMVFHVFEQ